MSDRKKVSHYCAGSIEVIDFIADQGWMAGFCLGNIVKYACRCERKGQSLDDLEKIINYAIMFKEHLVKGNDPPDHTDLPNYLAGPCIEPSCGNRAIGGARFCADHIRDRAVAQKRGMEND